MSYSTFIRLLNLKFQISKLIHTANSSDRGVLMKAFTELQKRLSECEHYQEYIRKIAFTDTFSLG